MLSFSTCRKRTKPLRTKNKETAKIEALYVRSTQKLQEPRVPIRSEIEIRCEDHEGSQTPNRVQERQTHQTPPRFQGQPKSGAAEINPPGPGSIGGEYKAGLDLAIAEGWLVRHESGTYVRFTEAGGALFPPRGGLEGGGLG
jgi:hypothetical protein